MLIMFDRKNGKDLGFDDIVELPDQSLVIDISTY